MSGSIRALVTVSLLVACAAVPAAGPSGANGPAAPSRRVTDHFYGTRVDDPYRNLENLKDPAVAAWMKAQAARAKAVLASIPGRTRLLLALTKYERATTAQVTQVSRLSADELFFLRRGPRDNQFKLYHRVGGHDTLLVDPDALADRAGGKPQAINWYGASPDGRHVVYGLSQQGSEEAVLYVKDVATGRSVGTPVTRTDYGSVAWAPDGRSFVFNRLQRPAPRSPATDKYLNSQMMLLRLGAPLASARPVFGNALPGLGLSPVESPSIEFTADGRWALGYASNGTQSDINAFFIAPQAGVLAGRPAWKRLFDAAAGVTGVAYHDDVLYLLSHENSPRFEVMMLDLKDPDLRRAVTVVSASERVITGIAAAADALYIEARDGNVKRLYKRNWSAETYVEEVALPLAGSFQLSDDEGGAAANPLLPGLLLGLESWTRARQIYAVLPDGSVHNTGLQPAGRFDAPADDEATEVLVTSHDGAQVPMSIVHRKGLMLEGRNPTLLYGYASYGMTEEPHFGAGRKAWLDAGGVIAFANPRGSGVYGDDWYKAGFQASKPNTWRDFIACAEYLIDHKYTTPERLGAMGASAGGILVGRAMTERPDLFAAVVSDVGALDSLRSEDTSNGPPNIPEFGSRKTPEGFKALLEMSTYQHIEAGVKYPAVLFIHGVNDSRVEVWESTKTAARLMAASASGRPVLLRLDYDSGHGIGDTKEQELAESADTYAFLLWQMGVAGYREKERR